MIRAPHRSHKAVQHGVGIRSLCGKHFDPRGTDLAGRLDFRCLGCHRP